MSKHIFLLTKPYNDDDFFNWYCYHKAMGWIIHVIANTDLKGESLYDYQLRRTIERANHVYAADPLDSYENLEGWPDQWNLFNRILNESAGIYGMKNDDIVTFIDDDEYLWFYMDYWKLAEKDTPIAKGKTYETIEDYCLNGNPDKLPLLVPQTLMSDRVLPYSDWSPVPLVDKKLFARNDKSSQGKALIIYNSNVKYDFTVKSGEEYGHVPAINGERKALVNKAAISTTTYGDLDPNACVRLYHYHLKSVDDYEKKWKRGSVSHREQWKPKDVKENLAYGNYTRFEPTMLQTNRLLMLDRKI